MEASSDYHKKAIETVLDDLMKKFQKQFSAVNEIDGQELSEKIQLIKGDENERSDVKGQVILKNLLGNILTDMENLDTESSKSRWRSSKIIPKFTRGSSLKGKSSPNDKSKKVLEDLGRVECKAKYLSGERKGKSEEDLELVGREKEKEEIVDQLMLLSRSEDSGESLVPVIAISGLAGIGKTKLARHVYQDQKVKEQVGLPAFVHAQDTAEYNHFKADFIAKEVIGSVVSVAAADFIAKKVLGSVERVAAAVNILVILDGWRVDIEDKDVKALQEKVKEHWRVEIEGIDMYALQQKLKEIWRVEIEGIHVKALKEAHPRVTAIMITTRNPFVVRKIAASSVKSYSYVLAGLNEKESVSLLEKTLGPGASNNSSIAKIVQQCRGVPLAIISIAKWLQSSHSQELTSEEQLICSFYDEDKEFPHECFAYFSLFPRDYLFDAERLIHLWMAEGFLAKQEETSNPSEPAEKTGRRYLGHLVGKSIFQDVKEDDLDQVRSFRMHPLMHDMARFVADWKDITVDPNGHKVHCRVLRASFDLSTDFSCGVPTSLYYKAESLETLLFFANTQLRLPLERDMNTSILENIFKSFKRLHVLDLHDSGIVKVPSSIGDLKDLKYLDLSQNNMEKLPSSISKLSKLQTLKLFRCYSLKELPKDFKKLVKLRNLDMQGCLSLTCMPKKMSKLTSLQTLSTFVANKKDPMGGLEELLKLNELRGHLEILHVDQVQQFDESKIEDLLEGRQKIRVQGLTLRWDPEIGLGESKHCLLPDCLMTHPELRVLVLVDYGGPNLSSWFKSNSSPFEHLVKVRLQDCQCKYISQEDALPTQLKTLELIRLDNLECVAQNCDKNAAFYKTLMELTVSDCPKLKSWWQGEKSDRPFFAKISKLHVHHCPLLTCMPLYFHLDKKSFLEVSFGSGIEVVLVGSSFKLLLDTMSMVGSSSTVNYSIPLEILHIQNCNHLENLSNAFQHLSSLQRLTIENCATINLKCLDKWEGLKSLRFLTIREIPIKSLSFGDDVTTMRELTVHNCEGLTSISDSIGKLTSLRRLEISKCNELKSLPKEMKNLKSLKTLLILNCNLLLSRCQPETGDDWPQISHVQHIQVK